MLSLPRVRVQSLVGEWRSRKPRGEAKKKKKNSGLEWKPAIGNTLDGPWGYYAKWDKSDRETNTVQSHLYVESKKDRQTQRNRVDGWLPAVGGCGKQGDIGQRAQTCRYKINSLGDLMYSMVIIANNTVSCTWMLLRVDLKSSHHKEKIVTCDRMEMVANNGGNHFIIYKCIKSRHCMP